MQAAKYVEEAWTFFALLDDALHSSVPLRDVVLYSRVNFKVESDIFPFANPIT